MALFRRKDNQSVLPDEVNEYYESQRRERTGMAIAMGLLALVITVLIGVALFFGGKFIYDKISGNDEANSGQVQTADDNNSTSIDGGSSPLSDSDNVKDSGSDKSKSGSDSSSDNNDFGDVSLDGGESSPSTQPATGDDAASMPATGDEPQVLPATGDPGH